MKKDAIQWFGRATFVAGMVFSPVQDLSPGPIREEITQEIVVDQRNVLVARSFLAGRPLADHAEEMIRASSYYKLDHDLLPIIAMAESGGGAAKAAVTTKFGVTGAYFPNDPIGDIWHTAALLASPLYQRGKTDIEKLQIFNSGRIGAWADPNYPNKYWGSKNILNGLRAIFFSQEAPSQEEETIVYEEDITG